MFIKRRNKITILCRNKDSLYTVRFEKIEHKILKVQRYPDIPSMQFQSSHPYILPITQKVIYFKVYAVAYKSTKRKSLKPALKLSFKPLKLPQTGIERFSFCANTYGKESFSLCIFFCINFASNFLNASRLYILYIKYT